MTNKVLLIVLDQFRADCLNGMLADAAPLPNMQSLMQEGTTFTQHYTVTTPCGPSRASLLTGLYAMNHRSVRNGTPLARQHLTIGHHMRKAGIEPMLFGYTDVSADPHGLHSNDPDLKNYEGLAPGFAEIVRMRFDAPGSWAGYLKANGYPVPDDYQDVYKPKLDKTTATATYPDGSPIRSPAMYAAEDSDTAYLTNRTLQELSALESQNWFALLTYIRPHPPLVAPSPFNTMYSPDSLPAPKTAGSLDELRASHSFFDTFFGAPSHHGLFRGFNGRLDQLNEEQIAELRAVYLGLAFEVDHHIGRVIDYLKSSNQYDDTLIIVTADHGEMLGDHRMWGKGTPLNGSLHIPLIIRDPQQPNSFGQQISAFTESIDIAPTLVDWVSTDAANKSFDSFNGSSLLPLMTGATPENWRSYVFAEAELGDPHQATHYQTTLNLSAAQANFALLKTHEHKYVHFNGAVPPMLFNLTDDPNEFKNLASDSESAQQLSRLSSIMLDHRMTHANHSLSNFKLTCEGLFTR